MHTDGERACGGIGDRRHAKPVAGFGRFQILILLSVWMGTLTGAIAASAMTDPERGRPPSSGPTAEAAERMIRTAAAVLQPVYAPLAQYIVDEYELAQLEGIGIDIGGGPGNLILELSRRTPHMDWINADYNPHFRDHFVRQARMAGVASRARFLTADVHDLPLPSAWADVVVSRGSFQFWDHLERGLSEIYRVLKPGGVALIGRGFPPNLPAEEARRIRIRQARTGGPPPYDPDETAARLERAMVALGIVDYRVIRPRPPDSDDLTYGVWLEFRRPALPHDPPSVAAAFRMDEVEATDCRWRDLVRAPWTASPGLQTAGTTVYRKDALRQQAAVVADALRHVPGARMEPYGPAVDPLLTVRGQRSPHPDYALAGVDLPAFRSLANLLPAADMERLEVMRSSAALLTGGSGLSGTVDLRPRRFAVAETSADVEFGSGDRRRLFLTHGNAGSGWSYGLTAQHHHAAGSDVRHTSQEMLYVRGSGYWQPAPRLDLQTHVMHLDGRVEAASAQPTAVSRYPQTLPSLDPFRATLVAAAAHWIPDARSAANLRFARADRSRTWLEDEDDAGVDADDREWALQSLYARELGRNNVVRVGGVYHRWGAPAEPENPLRHRRAGETWSVVAMDEHRWGSLLVDGGLRWSRTTRDEAELDGGAQSAPEQLIVPPPHDPVDASVWRAQMGAAYCLPVPVSLHLNAGSGYVRPHGGGLDREEAEYANEKRLQLDAGVTAARAGWGRVTFTGYWMRRRDALEPGGSTVEFDGRYMPRYVHRDHDHQGLELEIQTAPLARVAGVFGNWTVLRARTRQEGGTMVTDARLPRHIVAAGLLTRRGGWDLNLYTRYQSSHDSMPLKDTPGAPDRQPQTLAAYATFDVTGGYTAARLNARVYGSIRNLLDKQYEIVPGYLGHGRRYAAGLRLQR